MLGEGIWKWGADIVLEIQTWGLPILPFELVTYLGNETFYFILVPVFFWLVRPGTGIRLLGILLFSSFSNSFFKLWLTEPRPYWVNSDVKAYVYETSYGIPSGHSQNAVTIWGYLAYVFRARGWWVMAGAVLLMAVICFSRLVLGVHFPQDIIGGLVLGLVLLFVYIRTTDGVLTWYSRLDTTRKILYPFIISLILIAMAVALRSALDSTDPENWSSMAAMAIGLDGVDVERLKTEFDPRSLDTFISVAATLAGLGLALALSERSNHFEVHRRPLPILGVIVVGFVGIGFFRAAPRLLFDVEGPWLEGLVRYVRYALIMVWAAYWAPLVFKAFGWARPLEEKEMTDFLDTAGKAK